MKATLIKKAEGWYNLYQDKIGIGSTYPELQGYKLSKQNCDEIFGVIDSFYESISKLNTSYLKGFNKAMELNKDKQFTLEDLRTAMTYGIVQEGIGFVGIHSVDDLFNLILKKVSQPTEIEVEVEMEDVIQLKKRAGGFTNMGKPSLDAEGCILLKKAR
jgi:hypothetical protein